MNVDSRAVRNAQKFEILWLMVLVCAHEHKASQGAFASISPPATRFLKDGGGFFKYFVRG